MFGFFNAFNCSQIYENSLHVVVFKFDGVFFGKPGKCGTPAFKQPVKVFSYTLRQLRATESSSVERTTLYLELSTK